MSGRPGSNRRQSAWKAEALPTELLSLILLGVEIEVVGGGFEPPKLAQQIYSLPSLAT